VELLIMGRTFIHTMSLSIGGDVPTWEGEATVSYTVTWGAPERGPTYACGGTPADPDEIDWFEITHIDGQPVEKRLYGHEEAKVIYDHINYRDALIDALLIAATEEGAADYADAMEYRAEARREDAMMAMHDSISAGAVDAQSDIAKAVSQ
jgi:hypothetical protein